MVVWAPTERYGDREFIDGNGKKYDLNSLNIDEYYINFHSASRFFVYGVHRDCVDCPFSNVDSGSNTGTDFTAETHLDTTLILKTVTQSDDPNIPPKECIFENNFGEFGIYNVDVDNCVVDELREHVNIYFPIFTVFCIYALAGIIIFFLTKFAKRKSEGDEDESEIKKKRIKSLDAFRGLTILLMIFANYGSGGYFFIDHAPWNGLHVADVIFPCFIWIMGAVLPITLPSKLKNSTTKEIWYDILSRSAKLICLGIILGSGANLSYFRFMGVLQRFGIAYLVISIILMFTFNADKRNDNPDLFADLVQLWKGWCVVIVILITHCLVIFLAHAEDCPKGYLGPGGIHQNGKYLECVGGITGHIDRKFWGEHHVYQNPTLRYVYQTFTPFDPEGLLGCLTTIFHVFIGVQAGNTYATYKNASNAHFKITVRWLIWGLCLGLIGALLCAFSKEGGVIPINKNLWSLSFVLVTSCFAFIILTLFYFLIDQQKWWSGKPLLFAGMNAIALYAGHEILGQAFPFRITNQNVESNWMTNTHFGLLLTDTWGAASWLIVSYILYKKKIFITL